MKDFFLFISGVFAGKLIEDNVPNLHYKKLITGFEKHIAPLLLTAYLGLLYTVAKLTRNPQAKKNYTTLLALLALVIILSKVVEDKKQAAV